jgi:hypothetical protein
VLMKLGGREINHFLIYRYEYITNIISTSAVNIHKRIHRYAIREQPGWGHDPVLKNWVMHALVIEVTRLQRSSLN